MPLTSFWSCSFFIQRLTTSVRRLPWKRLNILSGVSTALVVWGAALPVDVSTLVSPDEVASLVLQPGVTGKLLGLLCVLLIAPLMIYLVALAGVRLPTASRDTTLGLDLLRLILSSHVRKWWPLLLAITVAPLIMVIASSGGISSAFEATLDSDAGGLESVRTEPAALVPTLLNSGLQGGELALLILGAGLLWSLVRCIQGAALDGTHHLAAQTTPRNGPQAGMPLNRDSARAWVRARELLTPWGRQLVLQWMLLTGVTVGTDLVVRIVFHGGVLGAWLVTLAACILWPAAAVLWAEQLDLVQASRRTSTR